MSPVLAALHIPESVRAEHDAIHTVLKNATNERGQVGAAAKNLAKVLHPHFVREEEIALPPLGALSALVAHEPIADEDAVVAMSATLETELPRMLDEHAQIREAVNVLRLAARAERRPEYERLADMLALHAQSEEDVFYPAAVLVGEVIRQRKLSRTP